MIVLDAGTTWAKIIETEPFLQMEGRGGLVKQENGLKYYIMPSRELKNLDFKFDAAAGHMSYSYLKEGIKSENEITALVKGFRLKIKDDNAVILDIGSRDIKRAVFKNGRFKDLDWNAGCSSLTGASIEMFTKFYNINPEKLKYTSEKYAVTCGIFGLEKVMDDVSKGMPAETAVSKFIHGIAYNMYNFAKKPEKLYLSGGFCENKCFVQSLENYCEVIPLGRFLLAEGLFS